METITKFLQANGTLLAQGTVDTLIMVGISTALSCLFGLVIGMLLVVVGPGGLRPRRILGAVLGWIVNMGRSLPFIILLVFMVPITRLIVGTSLGIPGAILPLVVGATPFVSRVVEQSLAEVDPGLVEAAESMGASIPEILVRIHLREALPGLVRGLSIVSITILGYTAMAGAVGAGGLGDLAIRLGHQSFRNDILISTVVILIVMVQIIQIICDLLVRLVDRRMRS